MTIKAVIFDLGGVLVRTEDRSPREQLAVRLGMNYDELNNLIFKSESARLATVGKITTQAHWEAVRNTLNMPLDEFSSVPLAFWGGDQVDTDLVDTIRALRPSYRTCLLSNAWDDLRQMLAQVWRIDNAFDQLVISAEVGVAKPAAEIYKIALARLGVNPAEAVFVDDFIENVEGARAAGMHALHFRAPDQARQELDTLLN